MNDGAIRTMGGIFAGLVGIGIGLTSEVQAQPARRGQAVPSPIAAQLQPVAFLQTVQLDSDGFPINTPDVSGERSPSGVPSGGTGGTGASAPNNAAGREMNAHQQIREEALTWMEAECKKRWKTPTAAERVQQRMATSTPLDPAGMSPELREFHDAATLLANIHSLLQNNPNNPQAGDVDAIVNRFDSALQKLIGMDADILAAELLHIAIKAIPVAELASGGPGGLLPVLLTRFLGQLNLDGILGGGVSFQAGEPAGSVAEKLSTAIKTKKLTASYQQLKSKKKK
ncbi:MAG: hypothetical protein AABP62_29235 [Planctomycetota bacterium]